ncbi:adhesion G protein-coupled receptor E3-like [Amblyraja radiata]|uniref:adhesion G protein-coupled receptor E3-like n=1 Tax=Amblyraja radiata TaxID=386614 RepID=UPI001403DD92|nr:adhesion G protein-coupled receptor E3-like [Amblyraja radiata]
MCVEGLHLHVMVRNLQRINAAGAHRALRWFMYPFSYGLPAIIVVVSAATNPGGYGSSQHCWLSIDKGLIWSFIAPVCAIILFNTVLFIVTLRMLRRQITRLNTQVTKIKDTRMLTVKAIAQCLVLGCTWILSLFHFQDSTTVLTYMFTIIHSLQGTLIFLILCVFNPQVREGYRSCWDRACGDWRSSYTDTASTSQPLTKSSGAGLLVPTDLEGAVESRDVEACGEVRDLDVTDVLAYINVKPIVVLPPPPLPRPPLPQDYSRRSLLRPDVYKHFPDVAR